jgi:hypothetical protein
MEEGAGAGSPPASGVVRTGGSAGTAGVGTAASALAGTEGVAAEGAGREGSPAEAVGVEGAGVWAGD